MALFIMIGCRNDETTDDATSEEVTESTTEAMTEADSNEDALAFKLEHEELNGQPNPSNPERLFLDMHIPENNPFRYADFDEINDLLENGTGVIYLGFPICPWCRTFVPVLTDAALEFGVEEILYRNILDDRNILELDEESGELVEDRAGHPGYYELLDIIGDFAPIYNVDFDDDSIRRVFVPAVIFVKDGEVVHYQGTLASFQERASADEELGGWQPKNDDEVAELTQIFMQYFEMLFGASYEVCPADEDTDVAEC